MSPPERIYDRSAFHYGVTAWGESRALKRSTAGRDRSRLARGRRLVRCVVFQHIVRYTDAGLYCPKRPIIGPG